jgi:hypothetical protein
VAAAVAVQAVQDLEVAANTVEVELAAAVTTVTVTALAVAAMKAEEYAI